MTPESTQSAISRLRRAGINIVKTAFNRKYKLMPAVAAPVAPVQTTTRDDLWRGIDRRLVSYYANRRLALSQAA